MMKKLTALVLGMLLLAGMFPAISASGAAGEPKAESAAAKPAPEEQKKPLLGKDSLEKAVYLVKSRVDIPPAYTEFSGDAYDDGSKTMFRLRWSSGNYYLSPVNGSTEVTVDENGTVIGYYSYIYDRDYEYSKRLPSITADQAEERARRFLAGMCPDIAGQVFYDRDATGFSIGYDGSYSFTFYRQVNGIPYYDNSVYIQVNGRTGEIINMNRNWNDSLVFPDAGKVISLEKAKEAYKKDIGLRLRYRLVSGGNSLDSVLQYSPAAADMLYAVDAATGSKIAVNAGYNPYNDYASRPYADDFQPVPESELEQARQFEGMMDADEGEKLARSMTELGLGSLYRLDSYGYSKTAGSGYSLRLEFTKAPSKEDFGKDIPPEKLKAMLAAGEGGDYASVVFDAATSELISFNGGSHTGTTPGKGVARAELQKNAAAFLGKYKSVKFKQAELADSAPYANDYMQKFGIAGAENSGDFIYERKANGITVEGNSMNISLDTATGRIISYSETWDDVVLAPKDGIISLEKAYDVLFSQNGLELKYVAAADPDAGANAVPAASGLQASFKVIPVYSTRNNKPVVIDAFKGILADGRTGEEYADKNTVSYADLAGSPHKAEMESLAKSGLLPLERNFRPDDPVLQKDFLCLLFLLRGNSAPGVLTGELTQTEQDGVYRQLISEGMLAEEERDPDAALTKEQAVKFLLKAVGYGKFAEMKGIFDCSFTDRAEIAPGLLGYAVIAQSLGITEGRAFEPKKELTRLEAAMMVYRYLMR